MKETPFIRRLTNLSALIIQKYHPSPEKIDNKHTTTVADYSPKEEYTVSSLLALGEIETLYDQLEQSPYFLTSFRQTSVLKTKGIGRFEHIIYHKESHLFRATGILDRLLLLINIIFSFKLTAIDAKARNILVNKNGKEGKHAVAIKNFDITLWNNLIELLKVVDQLRDERNEIAHQKRYYNKNLNTIEMFHILQTSGNPDFSERRYVLLTKQLTDEVVKEYKEEMIQFNKRIRALLDLIYAALEKKWVESYNQN